jgi:membrane protein YqaA with SNARE-associated domain
MITGHLIGALLMLSWRSMLRSLFHLGGLGLIPLGILDSSLLPLPGILDVATLVLSARQQQLWLYYAMMATAGSVLGGFITYRLSRKGGKEVLERKFSRRKVDKVCEIFERWGFAAIAIPAVLPPPAPMVPFVLAAGAMQYPARKFLVALTLGRITRYLLLSYLAARYGRQIIAFIAAHRFPATFGIIAGLLILSAVMVYFWQGNMNRSWPGKLGRRFF